MHKTLAYPQEPFSSDLHWGQLAEASENRIVKNLNMADGMLRKRRTFINIFPPVTLIMLSSFLRDKCLIFPQRQCLNPKALLLTALNVKIS